MKKICLLLSLTVVLSCVAGCAGTGDDSGTDTVAENETVTKGSEESTPTEDTESDTAADTTDDVTVGADESTDEVTDTAADTTTEPAAVTPEVTTAPETDKKPAVTETPTTKPAVTTKKEEEKPKEDTTKSSDVQPSEEPKNQLKIGDYITFGSYEQDNNTSNGKEDIEWLILDIQDNKALVISKYALDCKEYNTENTDVTWETCTLRQWLNNDFLNTAFTTDERSKIVTTKVTAEDNTTYNTAAGNDTQDKIFILSINEVNKYFISGDAKCKPTAYAEANGVYHSSNYDSCWWWLRTPGCASNGAAVVHFDGCTEEVGRGVFYTDNGFRATLWINLND